jgi:histidyl-tRNA synthetase
MTLQPVKGTRDFYPEEMRLRNWLFQIWRETSRQFGFEEYDACVLEHEELYVRKAGDEITGQLYNFEDKSRRRLALRPEMTPSLARLILQRRNSLTFPLKWFSIPQCFRYERMTRGRKREHFQWNLDVVGQPDTVAEAEVISALLTSLARMGLAESDVRIHVNDRRILNGLLDKLGVPADRHLPVMVVMDKRDKLPAEELTRQLTGQGLDAAQADTLIGWLTTLTDPVRPHDLEPVRKVLGENAALDSLERLFDQLAAMGLGGYARFDVAIVRGLSYYTGTVFEVRDAGASLRAICGGGRYDSLLSSLGGDPVPAIGFGFGDVVILELLADLGKLPTLTASVDFYVIPYSKAQFDDALQVAQVLRTGPRLFRCDVDFSGRKLKRALERADEVGARAAILLMPDEWKDGNVVVRNMAARQERPVHFKDLLKRADELLSMGSGTARA